MIDATSHTPFSWDFFSFHFHYLVAISVGDLSPPWATPFLHFLRIIEYHQLSFIIDTPAITTLHYWHYWYFTLLTLLSDWYWYATFQILRHWCLRLRATHIATPAAAERLATLRDNYCQSWLYLLYWGQLSPILISFSLHITPPFSRRHWYWLPSPLADIIYLWAFLIFIRLDAAEPFSGYFLRAAITSIFWLAFYFSLITSPPLPFHFRRFIFISASSISFLLSSSVQPFLHIGFFVTISIYLFGFHFSDSFRQPVSGWHWL